MKRTILVLPMLLVAVAGIAMAQPYKIKLDRPWKVGQKFSLISWSQSRQTMTMMSGLNQVSQLDSIVKIYALADAVVKSIEPLEIQYEIFQCLKFIGPDTVVVVPAGTEVVRTGTKGKMIRAVEGTLSDEATADLDEGLGNFNSEDPDGKFGTSEPQFVGGSWKINTMKMVKDLSSPDNEMDISEKDVDGSARLIGLTFMNDVPLYKVKVDLDLKKLKLKGLEAFKNQSTSAIIQYEGHFPIDETLSMMKGQLLLIMDIDASGAPGVAPGAPELTLKGRLTRSQTVEYTFEK